MDINILNRRKDGKYKVSYHFDGGPNGFGGTYPGKTINKILTPDQLKQEAINNPDLQHKFPKHIIDSLGN